MNPMTLSLIVFLIVAAVVGVVFFVFMDRGTNRAERLDTLIGKRRKESAAELLLKKSAEEGDKKTLLDALTPKVLTLEKLFEQADCNIKPSTLVGVSLVLFAISGSFSFILIRNWLVAPLVGLGGFTLPWLWLLNKRSKRLRTFAAQLPDALELVARALRAGHALGAGMHVVAEEMPAPISDEFGRVYEEQNLGIPLEDALRNMVGRIPNVDLKFFVTAVQLQRQTGGDLAEILDKIGHLIRERFKIWGQVQALTGEGRLSGIVLLALPPALFVVVYRMNPDYLMLLFTDDLGKKMLVGGIVMQIFGALVIRKIVNIRV
jgi:tight adherence protein B